MLNRRQKRAIKRLFYKLFRRIRKFATSVSKAVFNWFLRALLLTVGYRRRPIHARAGFVLPTVVMLLLVVSLVVAALLLRTGSRTNQVQGAREEQIIFNAATPAIERARAKLEYLFLKDKRFPTGAPSDEMLLTMLTNNPRVASPALTYDVPQNEYYYKLSDETPLGDINGDGQDDPAWSYQVDTDGDRQPETVVYSILLKRRASLDPNAIKIETALNDQQRADALVVRNGPINTIDATDPNCATLGQQQQGNTNPQARPVNEGDWFTIGSGSLRKTFQVDAAVISNKQGTSRTVATLEFQQDRQLQRANTGAWFRYDLEIFPGNQFNWNGSMYTSGNLIVGGPNGNFFRSYLISSPRSCFYDSRFPGASEITIYESPNQYVTDPSNPDFQGQVVSGSYQTGGFGNSSTFDVLKDDGSPNTTQSETTLDRSKDSVTESKPFDGIAVNPVKLLTQDQVQAKVAQFNNRDIRDPGWNADAGAGQIGYFKTRKRIYNRAGSVPFVDDTYRADDRYGPKSSYGRNKEVIVSPTQMGNTISGSDANLLTTNTTDAQDTEFRNLGWDGYWERRAFANGLRIIVGQRLELGNPFGFSSSDDPLLPPAPGQTLSHEAQQRRTLRDNLAAVQGAVVYHISSNTPTPNNNRVPLACIAVTSHPGTNTSIARSIDFRPSSNNDVDYKYPNQTTSPFDGTNPALLSDFFYGRGTNGWEYSIPTLNINGTLPSGDIRTALENLAKFAGDPDGAFPPKQQAGQIHPDPNTTMWGDFSNLRRALNIDGRANGSIADQSYIHSAACTVGMLANNVNYFVSRFRDPNYQLIGIPVTSNTDVSVLNQEIEDVVRSSATTDNKNNLLPDEILSRLFQAAGSDNDKLRRYGLARFIYMQEQIFRDRYWGQQEIASPQDFRVNTTKVAPLRPATVNPTVPQKPEITSDKVPLNCKLADFAQNNNLLSLAKLCPWQPKFPILNAIFPTANAPTGNTLINDAQIGNIVNQVKPRQLTEWQLPYDQTPSSNPNLNQFLIRDPDGNGNQKRVPLGDTGFFNGREMMTVRTLDIDLDLLRRSPPNSTRSIPGDTWLPNSGIVYAFREDAVREDAIARSPSTSVNYTNATNTSNSTDPALVNGVSIKAVDFVPDPYRRPHGFRLRNGQNISRGASNLRGLSFVSDNPVYIQGDFNFHSTDGSSNNLEEFTESLDLDGWSNFYSRQNLEPRFAKPATDFWRPTEIMGDAITILSKSFTEDNIADGIQDANGLHSFRSMNGPTSQPQWVREDNTVAATSSVPIKVDRNGSPMVCNTSPIAPATTCTNPSPYGSGYRPFGFDYQPVINLAPQTRVNAMLISGIVPSQINQSYGGFHNFPRFIEKWSDAGGSKSRMIISGSFVQLNFSNYATGPFSQNAWEPSPNTPPADNPTTPQFIRYYGPPARRWGYDVGLQYAPAGAIAQRLVLPPASRSEFYRDLKADDPYICKLRLALNRQYPNMDQPARQECR